MVEVTQSARRAAGSICVGAELRALILEGNFDDHDYVQAFAQAEARGREWGRKQGVMDAAALAASCSLDGPLAPGIADGLSSAQRQIAAKIADLITKEHNDG